MKRRYLSVFTVIAALVAITQSASAMYHPGMGRFMQRDPRGMQVGPSAISGRPLAAGQAVGARGFIPRDSISTSLQYVDGMNLYQYVGSKPTRFLDPTGLRITEYKDCTKKQEAVLRAADAAVAARMPGVKKDIDRFDSPYVEANYVIPRGRKIIGVRQQAVYVNYRRNMQVVFKQMISQSSSGIKVECECECDKGTVAYVNFYLGFAGSHMHFCPKYFTSSTRRQNEIFMHELSHYAASTDDRAFSWLPSKVGLAPDDAYYIETFMYGNTERIKEHYIWSKIWPPGP